MKYWQIREKLFFFYVCSLVEYSISETIPSCLMDSTNCRAVPAITHYPMLQIYGSISQIQLQVLRYTLFFKTLYKPVSFQFLGETFPYYGSRNSRALKLRPCRVCRALRPSFCSTSLLRQSTTQACTLHRGMVRIKVPKYVRIVSSKTAIDKGYLTYMVNIFHFQYIYSGLCATFL